jgi:hypothetical protein
MRVKFKHRQHTAKEQSHSRTRGGHSIASPTLIPLCGMLAIEKLLHESHETLTFSQVKHRLNRNLTPGALREVLHYLEANGKILIGKKGITWIYTEQADLDAMLLHGLDGLEV